MTGAAAAVEARFGRGGRITTARAPGRVNLIGEHTDYNEGFVLPTGIADSVEVAVRPREDRRGRLFAADLDEELAFALGDAPGERDPRWSRYLRGLAEELRARGLLNAGFDLAVTGTIPPGAGLSSSAALETATALALERAFGFRLDEVDSVRLCQEVEQRWVGVRCGIMDQMACRFAKEDHALLLDCRNLDRRHVLLSLGRHSLVLVDSGVRRELNDTAYNRRRRECEEAVAGLQLVDPSVRSLRDVDAGRHASAIAGLPRVVAARTRHVIEENARVLEAEKRLAAGELAVFGELMLASHASLRDLYEVSHPVLDRLVETAMEIDGVLGSRLTGAGFGGSTITLCEDGAVDELRERALGVLVELNRQGSVRSVGRATEACVFETAT